MIAGARFAGMIFLSYLCADKRSIACFGTDFVAQTIQKERNYIMDENKTTTQQTTAADKPKRVSKFWEACQKYKDDWIIYDPTILDRI